MEAYVAIEYKTDQQGYIVKKRVVICDNKKFKKITMEIFNQVKTLKIATTEKIDTIYFQYKIQGSPTLIHSKVDVKSKRLRVYTLHNSKKAETAD